MKKDVSQDPKYLQFVIRGVGSISCGKYLGDSQSGKTYEETWMSGYISGYNHWNGDGVDDALSKTDFKGAVGWVKNYCKSSPTDSLDIATQALIEFLRKK